MQARKLQSIISFKTQITEIFKITILLYGKYEYLSEMQDGGILHMWGTKIKSFEFLYNVWVRNENKAEVPGRLGIIFIF